MYNSVSDEVFDLGAGPDRSEGDNVNRPPLNLHQTPSSDRREGDNVNMLRNTHQASSSP